MAFFLYIMFLFEGKTVISYGICPKKGKFYINESFRYKGIPQGVIRSFWNRGDLFDTRPNPRNQFSNVSYHKWAPHV